MEVDPKRLEIRDRYKLLIGLIIPRPIAFVSTLSPDGTSANLAPFSFFNGVGSDPMTVLFCPANNSDGSEKDTLRNAKPADEGGLGEFVVNAAVEPYATKVAGAAEPLPYGRSEFDFVELTRTPSSVVRPPRIAEAPWAFECRTTQVIRTNPGSPSGGNIVIGEVVHIFVDDELINDRYHTDSEKLRAIGRLGGLSYCLTRDRFEMPMGRDALAMSSETKRS